MKKFITTAALLGLTLICSDISAFAQRGHGRDREDRYEHRGRGHGRDREDRYAHRGRGHQGRDRDHDRGYRHDDHRGRGHAYGHYSNHNRPRYQAPRHHRHGPPSWARAHRYNMSRHVYFPEYYTFYDANRGGYTYWGGNDWVFSTAVPSFLVNVNLGRARIQVMNDVPLGYAPQGYYGRYHKRFPVPRPLVPPVFIPRF
ncbi:MAG: hypothetical protein EOP54_16155 [Sphingobacteriales bacterium]|nr:MAG: hypothetical protein EOP54_16155 [Sphingobacteriales bacterium]